MREVEDLVSEWLALREAGAAPKPEDFAARHPECTELPAALRALVETESLLPAPASLPDVIGPYRVQRLLGRGATGVVLEAMDDEGQPVAIKLLAPALAANSRARTRLAREARVLSETEHPNVVRVLSAVTDGTTPYLVMERVEGEDLRSALDRGSLPETDEQFAAIARIGSGIARGLQWAHEQGLVHRDLKPSNIMLRPDGRPVVLDFGLAADGEATSLTATGDVLGTPTYMAPEQARGRRAGSPADVYALGAVLFEMIAGRPPALGRHPREVLRRVATTPAPRLRRVARRCPAPLARIVDATLAPAPRWRPAPVAVVADALAAFPAETRVPFRPPGRLARLAWRAAARPALTATLLAVVLFAVVLVMVVGDHSERTDRTRERRDAMTRVALAILDPTPPTDLEAAVATLATLDPRSPFGPLLRWIGGGEAPADSPNAHVAALVAAESALRSGHVRHALARLEDEVAAHPESELAWALLLKAARGTDDAAGVLEKARSASAGSPQRTVLRLGMAHLLDAMGRHRDAADAFAACDVPVRQAELSFHRAAALVRAGEARRGMDVAASAPPKLQTRLARLLETRGHSTEAMAVYRRVLNASPDELTARFHLANALASREQVRAAAREYRVILHQDPRHAPAMISLAWIHAWVCGHEACRAVEDRQLALELAQDAVRADGPRRPAVLLTATRIARHLGRREEMRALLRSLLVKERAAGKAGQLLQDGLRDLDQ